MKPSSLVLLVLLALLLGAFAQETPNLESRFKQLDKDGDGKVTAEEFPRPQIFARLDKDKDGSITLEEIRNRPANPNSVGDADLEIKKDIAYGEHAAQKMDVYIPKDAEKVPVMIYVHGGGWQKGDKQAVGLKPAFFAEQGWALVSVNYRLLPDGRHPKNAEDVAAAVAMVHSHAAEHGMDPDKLFLMGHSAGAHLVALVGTDGRHLEKAGKSLEVLKGVIPLDTQAYDIVKLVEKSASQTYAKVFSEDPETQADASPAHHIVADKGIPPFLICFSSGMGNQPNPGRPIVANAFAEQLKAAGIPAEVVDASDRNHGQINQWFGSPDDEKVTAKALEFLKGILGGEEESTEN